MITLVAQYRSLYLASTDTVIRVTANPRGRNAYVRHFDNVPMDSL